MPIAASPLFCPNVAQQLRNILYTMCEKFSANSCAMSIKVLTLSKKIITYHDIERFKVRKKHYSQGRVATTIPWLYSY